MLASFGKGVIMYGLLLHTALPTRMALKAKHRGEKFSLLLPSHLRPKGKTRNCSVGVHIGPFGSWLVGVAYG